MDNWKYEITNRKKLIYLETQQIKNDNHSDYWLSTTEFAKFSNWNATPLVTNFEYDFFFKKLFNDFL